MLPARELSTSQLIPRPLCKRNLPSGTTVVGEHFRVDIAAIAVFLNVSTESVDVPVASEIFSFVPVTSTEPRLKSDERLSVISESPTVSLKIT